MSCQAIVHAWEARGVTAEERLALLWIANASSGLGHPACIDWHGIGIFMCCGYERALDIVMGLEDAGLIRCGEEEGQQQYAWLVYGGEYFSPVEFWTEPKGRSKRVSALIDRDGPHCSYCGCIPVNYEVDHFIPRAKGGPDVMANLVLSCSPCNRTKRDKMPETFLANDLERLRNIKSNLVASEG
jgi:hypothetical protein